MPIVPIIVRSAETELITYAMLDNCSTGTFILVKVIRGLTVSDLDGNNSISLPKAFTKLEMPATIQDIPRPEQTRKWPHLARVADYVHPLIPNDMLVKGYARKVPLNATAPKKGKVWYLPHHAVYHPKKPDKVRIVFDCSARFEGTGLNDRLLH